MSFFLCLAAYTSPAHALDFSKLRFWTSHGEMQNLQDELVQVKRKNAHLQHELGVNKMLFEIQMLLQGLYLNQPTDVITSNLESIHTASYTLKDLSPNPEVSEKVERIQKWVKDEMDRFSHGDNSDSRNSIYKFAGKAFKQLQEYRSSVNEKDF